MSYAGKSTNYLRQRRHREKLNAAASEGDRLVAIEDKLYQGAWIAAREERIAAWVVEQGNKRKTVANLLDWLSGQSKLPLLPDGDDQSNI
jgi:hypothetical protein